MLQLHYQKTVTHYALHISDAISSETVVLHYLHRTSAHTGVKDVVSNFTAQQ